jgi:hypothetical protein
MEPKVQGDFDREFSVDVLIRGNGIGKPTKVDTPDHDIVGGAEGPAGRHKFTLTA